MNIYNFSFIQNVVELIIDGDDLKLETLRYFVEMI